MTTITEISPDVFRISTYIENAGLQFSQFLVRDDEPLLFHTGHRKLFPIVHAAVAQLIDPTRLRWICFSHFEADECGALNQWLTIADHSVAACSLVGVMVSVDDFTDRPARPLADGEIIATGKHRFQFLQTPQVPHCWDAGMLFEETTRTLFCSDLFHQAGDVEPLTESESEVIERHRGALLAYQNGPLANYIPYNSRTHQILARLAGLKPRILATMHGSVLVGDGEHALNELSHLWMELLGEKPPSK